MYRQIVGIIRQHGKRMFYVHVQHSSHFRIRVYVALNYFRGNELPTGT